MAEDTIGNEYGRDLFDQAQLDQLTLAELQALEVNAAPFSDQSEETGGVSNTVLVEVARTLSREHNERMKRYT